MSDLVGNPEDRFCHDVAQISEIGTGGIIILKLNYKGTHQTACNPGPNCLKLMMSLVNV